MVDLTAEKNKKQKFSLKSFKTLTFVKNCYFHYSSVTLPNLIEESGKQKQFYRIFVYIPIIRKIQNLSFNILLLPHPNITEWLFLLFKSIYSCSKSYLNRKSSEISISYTETSFRMILWIILPCIFWFCTGFLIFLLYLQDVSELFQARFHLPVV